MDVAITFEVTMKLKRLNNTLPTASSNRVPILEQKAGTEKRIRGSTWMKARDRIALARGYRCAVCGRVWQPRLDQVDHIIELADGGTNDDSNLQLLCNECHESKTKRSRSAR